MSILTYVFGGVNLCGENNGGIIFILAFIFSSMSFLIFQFYGRR